MGFCISTRRCIWYPAIRNVLSVSTLGLLQDIDVSDILYIVFPTVVFLICLTTSTDVAIPKLYTHGLKRNLYLVTCMSNQVTTGSASPTMLFPRLLPLCSTRTGRINNNKIEINRRVGDRYGVWKGVVMFIYCREHVVSGNSPHNGCT